jgi:hypothetical protein
VTFFVPTGAASVLNFSIPLVLVDCAGGGRYNTPFKILKATMNRNRTFSATASQEAVVNGASAKITYTVSGRFQGKDAAGAATAEGVYREDIVFADTPNRKCTSNSQSWTATKSSQPAKSSVEPGSYLGRQSQHSSYPVTFVVPAGARNVLNFSIPLVLVDCAGGARSNTLFKILNATIKRNRSFTATASQNGVVNGENAKLTYSVTGYFQGRDAAGAAIAEGVYREDIVFTDTPARRCTSNTQSWTATRTR